METNYINSLDYASFNRIENHDAASKDLSWLPMVIGLVAIIAMWIVVNHQLQQFSQKKHHIL